MIGNLASPDVEITPVVSARDIALVVPLVGQYWAFESIDGFEPDRVARQLEFLVSDAMRGGVWLASESGRAVGYAIVVTVFSLEHGGLTAEVDELFVVDGQRRRGVASALLQALENGSLGAGCHNLSLQLARTNERARAFYRRHGFTDRAQYELLEKTLKE